MVTLNHELDAHVALDHGVNDAPGLAAALLGATDMVESAALIFSYVTTALRCTGVMVVWSPDLPDTLYQFPPTTLSGEQRARLRAAADSSPPAFLPPGNSKFALVLYTVGALGRVVLLATRENSAGEATASAADWDAFIAVVTPHMGRCLEHARLEQSVQRLEKAEHLQRALFAIADMVSSDLDMTDMLRGLHEIVGKLMYAENFFIALYDVEKDVIRFIYFADLADDVGPSMDVDVPIESIKHGLTWHLIRKGRPMRGSTEQMRAQGCSALQSIGPDSLDCLGVPMLSGSVVRGAIVVQSYVERPRFTTEDQALLSFVASHILTALDRKQAHDELERRVAQRTQELAKANVTLTSEVDERQRGERLQNALFRIAELGNTAEGMERFLAAVHSVVGELINAENFYIAQLSEDRTTLQFPYFVDERELERHPRLLANGATEQVLHSGTPLLLDVAQMQRLRESSEMDLGASAYSWLGVPLICAGNVVGVVAVQSYSAGVNYTIGDQELLGFVSSQIARGLERRRAAEEIQLANAELEQRVATRTSELRHQIEVRERVESTLTQRNADLEMANQQLAGAQSQLLQSEKMASVGQLAAGVAHEINNPISFVHANLFSLKRYIDELLAVVHAYDHWAAAPADRLRAEQLATVKERVRLGYLRKDVLELLDESVEGIERVKKIVQDLKDFSHVGEAEWQDIDIHHCLESTLNVLSHELRPKADVLKEYGEVPRIRCLPFQINQVLLNLLMNAAHAFEQRGTITIATGHDAGMVWMRIADTGCGIDPAHVKRIFDPFFTTRPVGAGTGLGLSASYGIVQQHGGTIDVASEVGVGTTMTVHLPVLGADAARVPVQ